MTTTGTIDIAGLDGGPVSLASEQLDDLDVAGEGSAAARRRRRVGTMPSRSGTAWRPGSRPWSSADLGSRRRRRGRVRPRPRAAAQHQGRGPQHRRDLDGRGRPDAGHVRHARGRRRRRGQARPRGARLSARGGRRGHPGHGLATVLGFVSETGVAGLTLGGGFGYLMRRFGWTVDNLAEVEIVTADGELRTANRDRAPRAVLGAARRWRQLRGRHPVHASACMRSAR